MKRWILTIEGNSYKPKIYAETADKAKNFFSSEKITDIQPYIDNSYLKFIEEMTNKSKLLNSQTIKFNRIREWYDIDLSDGKLIFRLYKDNKDGTYYDITEYQFMSNNSLVYPITFTYSNPKNVYDLFFTHPLSCEVVSYRLYGQPKLNKPTELKGIKQSFSVDYIPNKCKCQCFIKDNDLWIKHRDFFSSSHTPSNLKDIGTPLSYRLKKYFNADKSYIDKFVYPDSWGDIILRNEAWIVFRNFNQAIHRDNHFPIQSMIKAFLNTDILINSHITELDNEWERFFENICKQYLCLLNQKTEI